MDPRGNAGYPFDHDVPYPRGPGSDPGQHDRCGARLAFEAEKKSTRGAVTPKPDTDLIRARLKAAEQMDKET